MRPTPHSLLHGFTEALRFLSRLPLPASASPRIDPDWVACLAWAPAIGLVLALGPALVFGLSHAAALPHLVAAALAVVSLILLTSALHEDGLADVADGFGGGATRARKLEIMRDSRIGAFGALALAAGLLLRVACVASALDRHGFAGGWGALALAAVVSRAVMLMPMTLLPPARRDGLVQTIGAMTVPTLFAALALAAVIEAGVATLASFSAGRAIVTYAVAVVAGWGMTALARRQIGGATGDVVGATQQVSEIAVLLALSAGGPLG